MYMCVYIYTYIGMSHIGIYIDMYIRTYTYTYTYTHIEQTIAPRPPARARGDDPERPGLRADRAWPSSRVGGRNGRCS